MPTGLSRGRACRAGGLVARAGLSRRAEAAGLLAASGSAEPERDAWTLIAWLEGTAFYALAGAGTTAAPTLDVLRGQLTRLLAGLRGDNPGAA